MDIYREAAARLSLANIPTVQFYVMGPVDASSAPSKVNATGPFGNYWSEGNALPTGQDTSFYLNESGSLTSSIAQVSAGILLLRYSLERCSLSR